MGRFVPMSGGSGLGVYSPGRLYLPQGFSGGAILGNTTGLAVCPFIIRPGVHQLVGLWSRLNVGVGTCAVRMGLWDDTGGRPGSLIKDSGVLALTPSTTVYAKALFGAMSLNGGPSGRLVHFGAVLQNAQISRADIEMVSGQATQGDPWADYGIDPLIGPDQGSSPARVKASLGAWEAGVAPAVALTASPLTGAAITSGMLFGGLIFA